jgi:ATP-dependent Lhr-like helicase
MLFVGPAAEQRFGRRNFMDMTAVFTGSPEFTVLTGRTELGRDRPESARRRATGAADDASSNPPTAAVGPAG